MRDGNRCRYCRRPADTLDHVLPKSRGGRGSFSNLVAACRDCNATKGARTPDEAEMPLLPPLRSLPRRFKDSRSGGEIHFPSGVRVPGHIHRHHLPVTFGGYRVVEIIDH